MTHNYETVKQIRRKNVDNQRYYCTDCDKAFQQKSTHKAHLETKKHKIKVGDIPPKYYMCDTCDLTFADVNQKWNHLRSSMHRKMIKIISE